jgi:hypothetical protein
VSDLLETGCLHIETVDRIVWVWGPPQYGVLKYFCTRCGALLETRPCAPKPDASNAEVVSGNRAEEESSPPTED